MSRSPHPDSKRPPSCALHVAFHGSGPDVVLVHGWGLHGGIWTELVQVLRPHWRISVLELPGHGYSADCEAYDLQQLAAWMGDALPGPRVWIGWSLGALACLQLALDRPDQVRGLGLLAATPRFCAAPDWQYGTSPQLLETFASELQRDARGVLMRFLGLQVQGALRPQSTLKTLRAQWSQRPSARLPGLLSGLEILRTADLRARLGEIPCPALVIAGDKDRLVPPEASAELAAQLGDGRYVTVPGAGHAPFVAQPEAVAASLRAFLRAVPMQQPVADNP